MRLALGVLCYARPVHTALTLGFLFANKSLCTDVHFFYGVPKSAEQPSPALLAMLTSLDATGHGKLHYLPEDSPRNTGSNVDNLMLTMDALEGYDAYFKIDDDVLIGRNTDVQLAKALLSPELKERNVKILTGQAVREHMMGPSAFEWDVKLKDGLRIATRSGGRSPMETYAAITPDMLSYLKANHMKPTCENKEGTFGPYSAKLFKAGARAALVLYPAIVMQHIGLTCTTGLRPEGAPRSWAPAKHWSPAGRSIEVPGFDFRMWESSHMTGTHIEVAMATLEKLDKNKGTSAVQIIMSALSTYVPGDGDVELPIGRISNNGPRRKRKVHRSRRRVVITPGR